MDTNEPHDPSVGDDPVPEGDDDRTGEAAGAVAAPYDPPEADGEAAAVAAGGGDGAEADPAMAELAVDEPTASRRNLIDLAVRRRDDLTMASLQRVLATLDVDVDEPTLRDDLRALDIQTVTLDDGRAVLRHAPNPVAADPSAPFYPPEAENPMRNPVVLGAIGVAVVMVLIVVLVLALHSHKKSGGTQAGGAGKPGATVPHHGNVVIAPKGPGADPTLKLGTDLTDSFTTNGQGLGSYPKVGPWIAAKGTWAVVNQQATLVANDPKHLSLAFFDPKDADVRAQVKVVKARAGAGLAFWVKDPNNFWLWQVSPSYSTVILDRIVDGKAKAVANSGLAHLPKTGTNIGVSIKGATIQLLVDGAVVKTITDSSPTRGEGLGLGSTTTLTGIVFDDMVFKKN